ncbi:unnamed protein product [Strongylus vulgaris]|uniref:Uncharacterized protein n=1 Tax=Strongylus vulgaris TaxID=40348 RepID=A0A3P7LBQ9_STRVU|nr:unnamed protein product [Strongylus vulgaris]
MSIPEAESTTVNYDSTTVTPNEKCNEETAKAIPTTEPSTEPTTELAPTKTIPTTEPSTEPTTELAPSSAETEFIPLPTRSIRRKQAKKIKEKKGKQSKPRESRDSPLEMNKEETNREPLPDVGFPRKRQGPRRRTKKVIRRTPAKVIKTSETLATTTEIIQEMSADLVRRKIQLYQQRKLAEARQLPALKKRRRVRIEGRHLLGDGDENVAVASNADQSHQKEMKVKEGEVPQTEIDEIKKERRDEKKPLKKGATNSSPPPTTTIVSTPAVGATMPGLSAEALKVALAKEIRKFVSKELRHKVLKIMSRDIFSCSDYHLVAK